MLMKVLLTTGRTTILNLDKIVEIAPLYNEQESTKVEAYEVRMDTTDENLKNYAIDVSCVDFIMRAQASTVHTNGLQHAQQDAVLNANLKIFNPKY